MRDESMSRILQSLYAGSGLGPPRDAQRAAVGFDMRAQAVSLSQSTPERREAIEAERVTLFGKLMKQRTRLVMALSQGAMVDSAGTADQGEASDYERTLKDLDAQRAEREARQKRANEESRALAARLDEAVRTALKRQKSESDGTIFTDTEIDAIAQAIAEASIADERKQAIRNVSARTGRSVADLEKLLRRVPGANNAQKITSEMVAQERAMQAAKEAKKLATLGAQSGVAASQRRVCPAGSSLILSSSTSCAVALSPPQTDGEQPVRRFRKELIKAGNYVKPADGIAFSVDRPMLDHWASTFATMKSNGVKVFAPSGHTTDPDRNRGWVEDIFRDGDSLFGVISLIGADAIAMAGRSDVSIFTQPEFTDGKGNKYEWPILHVALCTDPVVPGLRGFEAIAVPVATSQR